MYKVAYNALRNLERTSLGMKDRKTAWKNLSTGRKLIASRMIFSDSFDSYRRRRFIVETVKRANSNPPEGVFVLKQDQIDILPSGIQTKVWHLQPESLLGEKENDPDSTKYWKDLAGRKYVILTVRV